MAPPGGWRKRHFDAARRHGDEVRAQGVRSLYNETVRWFAHKYYGDRFFEAAGDPNFQELWRGRRDKDRNVRLNSLRELGILERDADGNWRYSEAYLAWLFE